MMGRNRTASGRKVALVLGSGGARGLAHIGVIDHLCSIGVEISYISGCSMGALVGGIYAAGELEAYTEWVKSLERKDIIGLLDFSFGMQGLLKGEKIIGVLREMIGDRSIAQRTERSLAQQGTAVRCHPGLDGDPDCVHTLGLPGACARRRRPVESDPHRTGAESLHRYDHRGQRRRPSLRKGRAGQ
jgi:hypothetical protein